MDALAALPAFIHTPAQPPLHAAKSGAADETRDRRAWETAQDFEAQFVSTLFQSMYQGVGEDDPFSGGPGETMFRSMLVDQYGKQMAQSGGIGIADAVYREMLKMQEMPQ
ncbi:rod-binding protein [Parvibaculum sp.]|uniref:rod-binding protein n=1 Tax=Parvibaculum sp. TaxID=2024848 RepID=UPI0027301066|nr:rod-binding protein [Parvibaculum sp.]MDP1627102.1 rod-binding protein [Parvibaculum sp.]MDP2149307.1 rod-binding protein [Parvibaculum sp.]MDP3328123.1 rod-binding protein [Parvibaculum sp.]